MATTRPDLLQFDLPAVDERHGGHLVVLVHGLGSPTLLDDVAGLIRERLPKADLAIAAYNAGLFSNIGAATQARQLAIVVGQSVNALGATEHPYKNITLIGHSIGALLIRGAYLMARGDVFPNMQAIPAELRGWANPAVVRRMVLLGGLNQGWSVPGVSRLGHLRIIKRLMISMILTATELMDQAKFMRSVIAGAPFVHDVRIKWLHLMHRNPEEEPHCIQMYGDTPGLLDDSNVNDFLSGANFRYKVVVGTGHFDLPLLSSNTIEKISERQKLLRWANLNPIRLFRRLLFRWMLPVDQWSPDTNGSRKDLFARAIFDDWQTVKSDLPDAGTRSTKQCEHVILLRHGIRDENGTWMSKLKTKSESLYPADVHVDIDSFGRFSMLQFLMRGERISRVYDFVDRYLNLKAQHWDAKFHFFGHSYGTYIGCKALRDYEGCEFENVVLGNAVMARDFPWASVRGKYTKILNLRGRKDWVVAWFPGFFEWWRSALFFISWRGIERTEFLGSAGFNGFNVDLNQVPKILAGSHDASTKVEHHEQIIRFLVEGKDQFSSEDKTSAWIGAAWPPLILGPSLSILLAVPVAIFWWFGWPIVWAILFAVMIVAALLHLV